jgi:hypothetical protein
MSDRFDSHLLVKGWIPAAQTIVAAATENPGCARALRCKAVSAAYYALFHAVCEEYAAVVVPRSMRDNPQWKALVVRAYRTLDHSKLEAACSALTKKSKGNFITAASDALRLFCSTFLKMKNERQKADYDPLYSYTQDEAEALIDEADAALGLLLMSDPDNDLPFLIASIMSREPRP